MATSSQQVDDFPRFSPSDEQITNALVPALHILDSFNHRNKNQHCVANWWSHFNLLRRSVRRLNDALLIRLRKAACRQNQTVQKRKKQQHQQKPSEADNALEQDINARVQTLVDTVIPASFLAFTELIADSQHAALGLVLLGVLASVNSAVALIAPQPEKRNVDTPVFPIVPLMTTPVASSLAENKEQLGPMGLGVSISRDQLHLPGKARPKRAVDEPGEPGGDRKKPNLVGPVNSQVQSKPAIGIGKSKMSEIKVRKKKTKKGDDFSDLFSSLI